MSCAYRKIHRLLITVLFSMLFPAVGFSQQATLREYPYLYKSTRAMGMGGAYTAVGGTVDSLFYNPAGLSVMPKDKGWEVNLINVSAEVGKNALNFVKDLNDALDTSTDENGDGSTSDDQFRAVNDVFADYRGRNMHLRIADFTSIGKSFEKFAIAAGGLGSLRADAMTHQGFGPEGFLEVNSDITYGGVGGVSIPLSDSLFAGLGIKALHRELLAHQFTARELIEHEDNLDDYIIDDLRKTGSAVGFDAGVIYKFAQDSRLKPSLGVSLMNIADTDFEQAGKIPMTVNAGVALNPQIPFFRSLIIGVDYVDIFNGYEQDSDIGKRLRYGAELQLFDKLLVAAIVRAGMYEGYPTFGFDLRALIIDISYVVYTEEVGAYAGQDRDKRQLLTLNIGW